MADIRITPQTALAAQIGKTPSPAKAEAVRAAQRAFFEAAMGQTQAETPVSASAQSASPTATGRVPTSVQLNSSEPSRFARPGSILDIKV